MLWSRSVTFDPKRKLIKRYLPSFSCNQNVFIRYPDTESEPNIDCPKFAKHKKRMSVNKIRISTLLVALAIISHQTILRSNADDRLENAISVWQGEWETTYGKMVLKFSEDGRFEGFYGEAKHALRGRLDGKNLQILNGSWKHTGSTSVGLFRFKLSEDKSAFGGVWTTGETQPDAKSINWTGKKSSRSSERIWRDGEKPKWTGTWDTTFGELVLKSSGDGRFTGSYGSLEHSVSGTIHRDDPKVLSGTWKHSDSDWTGRFRFRLESPNRFRGQWTSGEVAPSATKVNWIGTRKTKNPNQRKSGLKNASQKKSSAENQCLPRKDAGY